MEDFDAPSFSLGLDESQVSRPSNCFFTDAPVALEPGFSTPRGTMNLENPEEADNLFEDDFCEPGYTEFNWRDTGLHGKMSLASPKEDAPKSLKRLRRGPSSVHVGSSPEEAKTPAANMIGGKLGALHSFWKSLSDNKNTNKQENDISSDESDDKDDEIGEFSSEDEFQPRESFTQSSVKLSLCGSAARRGKVVVERDPIASVPLGSASRFSQSMSQGRTRVSKEPTFYEMKQKNRFLEAESSDRLGAGTWLKSSKQERRDEPSQQPNSTAAFGLISNGSTTGKNRANLSGVEACDLSCGLDEDDFEGCSRTSLSDFTMCGATDDRIKTLLRQRLPHFVPVSDLLRENGQGSEQVYIDYISQFTCGKSAPGYPLSSSLQKQAGSGARKKTGTNVKRQQVDSNSHGWVQPGVPKSVVKSSRSRSQGAKGSGHWITEKSGKRIYVTRDGQKLSGSSAYKQHMKESGKPYKKSRRRRAQKQKRTMLQFEEF